MERQAGRGQGALWGGFPAQMGVSLSSRPLTSGQDEGFLPQFWHTPFLSGLFRPIVAYLYIRGG